MIKKYLKLVIMILLIFSIQNSYASASKLGTAGAVELLIPMGAYNVGMSGANISNISGTDAIYWNPAGLANSDKAQVSFSYLNYFADMKVSYFAAAADVGKIGTIGISLQSLNIGGIDVTTVDMPEGTGQTINPDYLTVGVTYSKKFSDRILFGTNVKMISENIGNMSAKAVAFDFGLQYVTPFGISFGIVMKNYGNEIKFDGTEIEFNSDIPFSNPNGTTRKTKLDMATHELPTSLNMGLAYDLKFGENNLIRAAGSYSNNSYELDQIKVGGEFGFNDMIFVRSGYFMNLFPEDYEGEDESQFGLSFGFGIKINFGNNKLVFNYANRPMELFSSNQYFSMGLIF